MKKYIFLAKKHSFNHDVNEHRPSLDIPQSEMRDMDDRDSELIMVKIWRINFERDKQRMNGGLPGRAAPGRKSTTARGVSFYPLKM